MAKFYGAIGYTVCEEIRPGVWQDRSFERKHYGDVLRNTVSWSNNSDSTNDDLRLNCQFSIVADPFISLNFHSIKYVEYMGAKWKVTTAEPLPPRILLNVGGVYNGK